MCHIVCGHACRVALMATLVSLTACPLGEAMDGANYGATDAMFDNSYPADVLPADNHPLPDGQISCLTTGGQCLPTDTPDTAVEPDDALPDEPENDPCAPYTELNGLNAHCTGTLGEECVFKFAANIYGECRYCCDGDSWEICWLTNIPGEFEIDEGPPLTIKCGHDLSVVCSHAS